MRGVEIMQYVNYYDSRIGEILLAANDIGLTGLWFANQKYYADNLESYNEKKDLSIFETAKKWLDTYFSGCEPAYMPGLHLNLIGTDFQIAVWRSLLKIPYGTTTTYGEIAEKILNKTYARAVGSAVSRNPISIIIPCHRVIGSNNKLTGYAGGIDKKLHLLNLEKIDTKRYI